MESNELFLSPLPKFITRDDLFNLFSQFDKNIKITIKPTKNNPTTRNFAFIRFSSSEEAKNASLNIPNAQIKGWNFPVRIAKTPQQKFPLVQTSVEGNPVNQLKKNFVLLEEVTQIEIKEIITEIWIDDTAEGNPIINFPTPNINLVDRAAQFAIQAHDGIGQIRKFTKKPYWIHPKAVAKIVGQVTDDQEMIAAAWLHDTVEDTLVTIEDIQKEFGERVAQLVENLTDVAKPEHGNRRTRIEINQLHTEKAVPEAKTIKLADIIHNSYGIIKYESNFAKVWIREIRDEIQVLKEGDPILYQILTKIINSYYRNYSE